jgi:nucleoid-associated protein YgaU
MAMGLFDKMFGKGAAKAQQQPNADQRFQELKQRYDSALTVIEQQQIQLQNLHVEDNKLFIRGTAPSVQATNAVWDQVKRINPSCDDITLDLQVSPTQAQGAVATGGEGGQAGQTYSVKSGDTLSKISKQFYGDPNEYMRIFYANRDKLRDPDRIQIGQRLVIPPDTDS